MAEKNSDKRLFCVGLRKYSIVFHSVSFFILWTLKNRVKSSKWSPGHFSYFTTVLTMFLIEWIFPCNVLYCCRPQASQKMYSSSSKGPSESDEDARNKPVRFSTSKARHMTLTQTLGYGVEIDHNPSKKSIYVGMFLMAVITYIILFLPANEDELDLLELEIENEGSK